ncbi:MAG: site-specific DNA-methyltransferase [Acidimicrobiia bacterium]
MAKKRGTETSSFGVGRRESHDASRFYARFSPPELSDDDTINPPVARDQIFPGNAKDMTDTQVADASVALVVTSPPYFAGKEYEEALGQGHVPATYFEYLSMLEAVFARCVDKLEPGGRMAINVANLGRRPYRSLSSDVITMMQDLGLLLRGEIIWQKARGASGSCAWGSFQSPTNPVFRDLTERVVVASKGRFDRAKTRREREQDPALASEISLFKEEFMEATIDLWEIAPEMATRVGHPAPFPVELPQRLIELYTYRNDLVLDPFMGSGTTAVAALRTKRSYVGFDTDRSYVDAATARVDAERARLAAETTSAPWSAMIDLSAPSEVGDGTTDDEFQRRAVQEGHKAEEIARRVLVHAGFEVIKHDHRTKSGAEVDFVVEDQQGREWYVDVSGAFTSTRAGLRRTDTLWKSLGKAAVLRTDSPNPILLLTTDLPVPGSAGDAALTATRDAEGGVIHDAIEMLSPDGLARLRRYALGGWADRAEGELLPPARP